MSWWETFVESAKAVGGDIADFASSEKGIATLGGLGLSYGLDKLGLTTPQTPKIGYQGKIPEYQAVRERVETDPNRRVGGQNQRYFSDMQYAKRPDTPPPSVAEAQAKAKAQAAQLAQQNLPPTGMAMGGIASANKGYFLGGKTDGMADKVPARIDGTQEARLSDGEFVIPADVVSHLGNGNSDAGAQQLHGMMSNVREARTGNPKQGKQIDPKKFMPKKAGGPIQKFQEGGETDPTVGKAAGTESSLSNWAGDYVTDMLGKGKALGSEAYQAYQGPLTAGATDLQDQAFSGIGSLTTPENMGAYTPQTFGAEQAQQYMNPYLMASLNPQLDEARRQAEIDRVANAGRMTRAGAFGGSRQALMDMEGQRNLQANLANITGQGYAQAYDRAQQQFNTEQGRNMEAQNMANQYGFDVLGGQASAGATQRGIASEGIAADRAAFEEERDFPYRQVQYMQSLLQGLPLTAQSYSYTEPSKLSKLLGGAAAGGGLADLFAEYGVEI
jgi:hypothetical protein